MKFALLGSFLRCNSEDRISPKTTFILNIHLRSGVGILKSTFMDLDHFTLWRYRDFDLMKILEKVP